MEGQPNEYDVIYRNASVLAFHLWPMIFAGARFRLQNICRNGVPPRSRTTTPLVRGLYYWKLLSYTTQTHTYTHTTDCIT